MPWQLTTPVSVGDLDPNGPYNQVKILMQVHDGYRNHIRVDLEYGNTVDNEWVRGIKPTNKDTSYIIMGQDYTDLVTGHATEDGELTYDAVKRGLYEHLATKGVIDPGSIV